MPTLLHWRTPVTRLLTAELVSQFGSGMRFVALPLLASTMTDDPLAIAALSLAGALPPLLVAMPIGVIVDRLHRGRLMLASDMFCLALLAGFAVLVALGQHKMWHLFLLAGLVGVAELVFSSCVFAILPTLVAPNELIRANGFLSTAGELGGGVLGPAVAGVWFATAAALPFAGDAASFAVSAALIASFAWHRATLRPANPSTGRTTWREITAGVRLLGRHRLLRAATALTAATGLFGWMPEATFVLFAKSELGASNAEFGVLMAATPIGAVLGGLLAGRIAKPDRLVPILATTMGAYGVITFAVGLAQSIPVAAGLLLVQGLPLIVCTSTLATLQQVLVPDGIRGRFAAVRRMINSIVVPTGLALGGVLAGWLGLRAPQLVGGLGCLLALALTVPGLRAASFAARSQHEQAAE